MKTEYNDTLAFETIGRKTVAIVQKEGEEKQVIIFTRTQKGTTNRYFFQENYIGTVSEGLQIANAYIDMIAA